ncbi:MAG TPA: hypothetical protein VFF67_10025 [Thermoplasmata archaeon]|nr:hypothetical protein [Thermoplasmata archaeon]
MTSPLDRARRAVDAALAKYGLLPVSDPEFPSVTSLVAGRPVRGSWWGHPSGQTIYRILTELEEGRRTVCARIIDGKMTFLGRPLARALFSIVARTRPWQLDGLPAAAGALHRFVVRRGAVRHDQLPAPPAGVGDSWRPMIRLLESRMLLSVGSVHTEFGRHELELYSWANRRAWYRIRAPGASESWGRGKIEEAVDRWTRSGPRLVALPWRPKRGPRRRAINRRAG